MAVPDTGVAVDFRVSKGMQDRIETPLKDGAL
ncbi:hypothetical protein GQ600_24393 [Phytophthora cactorum]|nr:hypothetical protein GQ600_24393 [Phytophthora cactorum]